MDYSYIDNSKKIQGIESRIEQLEGEHYSNEVYLIECDAISDDKSREHLENQNRGIVERIRALNETKQKLQNSE